MIPITTWEITKGKKKSDLISLIPNMVWFKNMAKPNPIGTANINKINHLRLFINEI